MHALGNVVSLKLMCPPDVDMVSETNKHLPKDILVLDMKRVTKGFNAKNQAEGRRYQYLIPSYAFMKAARPSAATCRKFVDDAFFFGEVTPEKTLHDVHFVHLFYDWLGGQFLESVTSVELGGESGYLNGYNRIIGPVR